MQALVGLETNVDGKRSIAWVLNIPGCTASGADGSEALLRLPKAILDFSAWGNHHAPTHKKPDFMEWLEPGDLDIRLVDTQTLPISQEREIHAWFRDDQRPLSGSDIQNGLTILHWQRADLLQIVSGLSAAILDRTVEGQTWTIRGLLANIANVEWGYLEHFGLAEPGTSLAENGLDRLEQARICLEKNLPGFAGQGQVFEVDGEFWSPRKLLRCAIWHEREQIARILPLL
jgi:hypothetical protein